VIKGVLWVALLLPLSACIHEPCSSSSACSAPPKALTVFAASSLQPAFDSYAAKQRNRYAITFNYAGSQTLAAQLEQGAQADVFASADAQHMTEVEKAGLVDASSAQVFAHNRLEIAVTPGNPKHIQGLQDLSRSDVIVVLADPSVPAGKYAYQALAKAHVTVHPASLEPQVTGVLSKIALGEADVGIVYVSDVTTNHDVEGVSIPDAQNVIADYWIAPLYSAPHRTDATAFVAEIVHQAQPTLKAAGFQPV
jgi:molybdate transport system substrate-binding protein